MDMEQRVHELENRSREQDKAIALLAQTVGNQYTSIDDKLDVIIGGKAEVCTIHTEKISVVEKRLDLHDKILWWAGTLIGGALIVYALKVILSHGGVVPAIIMGAHKVIDRLPV